MPDRILFIVNPHAGTSKIPINEGVIKEYFDHSNWSLQLTEYAGHAREIAISALKDNDVVVAIGGDGTVNEVASALIDTTVRLGIIPMGSGNGLSNFLGIPRQLEGALKIIRNGSIKEIDTMSLNKHRFVNMAGVGFDAHIAHLFNDFGSRGFISYSKLVAKEFRKYEGIKVKMKSENKDECHHEAFVLSFANSSQYGNNAHIAPLANISDGLADICSIKKFPIAQSPFVLYRMFNKSLSKSSYYDSFKTKELKLVSNIDLLGHIDGEPVKLGKEVLLTVYNRNLKVLVPQ